MRIHLWVGLSALCFCRAALGQVDVPATIPAPTIVGWSGGQAPFCVHVRVENLHNYNTGVANSLQGWYEGTFEWRFTKALTGERIDPADRIISADIAGDTIEMDVDQQAWNAACWLPTSVTGGFKAAVRYRNREGLYCPWVESDVITVNPNIRGRIWVKAPPYGNDSNCGTDCDPVATLNRAIELMYTTCNGGLANRREIIIDGSAGPVYMATAQILRDHNVYIRGIEPEEELCPGSLTGGGGSLQSLSPAVVRVSVADAFTLGSLAYTEPDVERLVFKNIRFEAAIPNAGALWTIGSGAVKAWNATFIDCTFGSQTGTSHKFSVIWNATENLGDWVACALINCDRVPGTSTLNGTLYGLLKSWLIWDCAWGPPSNEAGFVHTCRLTWRDDPAPPPAPPSSETNGESEYVSLQSCVFDWDSYEEVGTVLRTYVWRYFMAHNCSFLNGPVSVGQADIDHYTNPNDVLDHKFSRCRFVFGAPPAGLGDFIQIRQGVKRLQLDGCYFESAQSSSSPLIEMREWGGTPTTEAITNVSITNCTLKLSTNNVFYDETLHEGTSWPLNVLIRNNLFICKDTSVTLPHIKIKWDAATAAGSKGYRFRRNVYRDGLPGTYKYAVLNAGADEQDWSEWNDEANAVTIGQENRQTNLVLAGNLEPPEGVARTWGAPNSAAAIRAYSGASFFQPGTQCYAGAYQPVQGAPVLTAAVPSSGTVTLAWDDGFGADEYWIHYDNASGGSEFQHISIIPSAGITNGIVNGTRYWFRVMGRTYEGSLSKESNERNALPQ